MPDKIEKVSDTEIKIISTAEKILPVVDIKQQRQAALDVLARIDERRALVGLELQAVYEAQLAIIADCDAKLTRASELGVVDKV